ncbi:nonribosomal peptide synthase SidD [Cordyceps javanica]|uniref:Nonribosomal peptide synthase SidD n=1 Tax=Cordyceps javanica TaxID=43265 RepID=A0A545VEX8_9HYPO|nr:nonribosomal peptide synthase SidD [Cordyceps javanica]TQW11463.1 nonribosomal peptide synthase SidD [Cordyceps javanica]
MVLMDPTLPLARLQNMRDQVSATLILSSSKQREFSSSIIPDGEVIVVDEIEVERFTTKPGYQNGIQLPPVPSSSPMYLIFTSGSTGTPKGVMVSHKSYTSSAIPRAAAVGYKEDTRVLDFASYAFDVSIDSMLLTLGNGGCLCIPSDEDRVNDINGVMKRMKVSYAGITPSMARLLEPDVIKQLSALGLGGEAASTQDVNNWGKITRIVIGYGPCECTIGCTINSDTATGRDYISIGTGNGAAIWIIDPDDHETLMPIGAVGELLVEGPIVGQGYLNDPEKTAASFIEDPKWLLKGYENYHGRHSVLYKTGDLGMYDPDGSGGILFVGRKDTQVKLRGQRIELGEIESRLRASLPSEFEVVAEVIKPTLSGSQPTLVAFIAPKASEKVLSLEIVPLDKALDTKTTEANAELIKVLPRYMIPSAYLLLNHLPLLISGKVDRKKIRELGAQVDLRQNLDNADTGDQGRTALSSLEEGLRNAWNQTLKTNLEYIGRNDNFFALGGDSLAAMRLVSVCRDYGISITVADIFANPTWSSMVASAVEAVDLIHADIDSDTVQCFSLISDSVEAACKEAASACECDPSSVEDIYPCTPTQESLFTFAMKSATPYVAQRISQIPDTIDLVSWKAAWEATVAANPILRTRVMQLQSHTGFSQVVLNEPISWLHSTNLDQYLREDKCVEMGLGQRLARYAIVEDTGKRYMVWTIHHVVYDGFSEPLLLGRVRSMLNGDDAHSTSHMRHFVKFLQTVEAEKLSSFWRDELNDAIGPQFPSLPSRDYFPTPNATAHHIISLEQWKNKSSSTIATLLRSAWAIVASKHISSDDVVFGETLMGRDIALAGVESICGPMVATVPIRVQIDFSKTVSDLLRDVQQTMSRIVPYQHAGMQNIRKASEDAQFACETGTGIVIQPASSDSFSDLGFQACDAVQEALHFNPYPLMIAFGLGKTQIQVSASFDDALIDVSKMNRILAQLETAFLKISQGPEERVEDISIIPATELNQLWAQNRLAPLSHSQPGMVLNAVSNITVGGEYPPTAVSWVCDSHNSSLLAPIGCIGELCFEGDALIGELVESPPWLLVGSSGHPGRANKVRFTGDMVKKNVDGSVVYLGRKDAMLAAQRSPANLSQLQAHMSRYLPASVSAAPVLYSVAAEGDDALKKLKEETIVFVEQRPSLEETLELLWMKHEIRSSLSDDAPFVLSICANTSKDLASILNTLTISIRSSLPSRVLPLAYLPVERLPRTSEGELDRGTLQDLANKIPRHIIDQLKKSLEEFWLNNKAADEILTPAETILRAAWAGVLGREPGTIDLQDNFFRMGGDSVLAMKLVSLLRSQGHSLTVANIFKHMRLGDAARVLKVDASTSTSTITPYVPFSLLETSQIEDFVSENIRGQVKTNYSRIMDAFPVGSVQKMDVCATVNSLRTSVQYTLLYFDADIDKSRLLDACKRWIGSHEILRTVFTQYGDDILQVVLDGDLDVIDAHNCGDEDLQCFAEKLCKADIETDFQFGMPFTRVFPVEHITGKHCLALRLSHAQYDGVSLPLLLESLNEMYSGDSVQPLVPFSHYKSFTKNKSLTENAVGYWKGLLHGSSPSMLSAIRKDLGGKALFEWQPVNIDKLPANTTTATFANAVWAVVLARHLGTQDVTFGSVTSGRGIDFAGVERVAGSCYQFTPLRVDFSTQSTCADVLQHVQQQAAESAAYDFLGCDEIAARCTDWQRDAGTQVFDSVVHHQDWDDFDTMPFGKGTCRVDILNPHGDAPYPLKIVSFVREGKLHFGIVGHESDAGILRRFLGMLIEVAKELVQVGSEPISLSQKEQVADGLVSGGVEEI